MFLADDANTKSVRASANVLAELGALRALATLADPLPLPRRKHVQVLALQCLYCLVSGTLSAPDPPAPELEAAINAAPLLDTSVARLVSAGVGGVPTEWLYWFGEVVKVLSVRPEIVVDRSADLLNVLLDIAATRGSENIEGDCLRKCASVPSMSSGFHPGGARASCRAVCVHALLNLPRMVSAVCNSCSGFVVSACFFLLV